MLQNIIFILIIIFLMAGAFFWMWKLSRWLVIPIQVILFVLLLVIVFKTFATKDNAERLKYELESSKLTEVEQNALSGAMNAFTGEKTAKEEPAKSSDNSDEKQPDTPREQKQSAPTQSKEVNFLEMM